MVAKMLTFKTANENERTFFWMYFQDLQANSGLSQPFQEDATACSSAVKTKKLS